MVIVGSHCHEDASEGCIASSDSGSRSFLGSGSSVIVASVSSSTMATDTAFSSATRTTLVGSKMPGLDQVDVFLARPIETEIAFALEYARHHDAAIDRGSALEAQQGEAGRQGIETRADGAQAVTMRGRWQR